MPDNIALANIFLTFKFEAMNEENPFTKEQRDILIAIIAGVEDLRFNPKNPFTFAKNLKKAEGAFGEYERLFKLWGGNHARLLEKMQKCRKAARGGII